MTPLSFSFSLSLSLSLSLYIYIYIYIYALHTSLYTHRTAKSGCTQVAFHCNQVIRCISVCLCHLNPLCFCVLEKWIEFFSDFWFHYFICLMLTSISFHQNNNNNNNNNERSHLLFFSPWFHNDNVFETENCKTLHYLLTANFIFTFLCVLSFLYVY